MLESLNYSFRNRKKHNLSNYRIKQLREKNEDPSLVNNVDELGLVY